MEALKNIQNELNSYQLKLNDFRKDSISLVGSLTILYNILDQYLVVMISVFSINQIQMLEASVNLVIHITKWIHTTWEKKDFWAGHSLK